MIRVLVLLLALSVFSAPAHAQARFQPDSQISVRSWLVPNNTTAVVIADRYSTLYHIEASNNSSTLAYIKVYNAASATCGAGTPRARYMIPASATVMLIQNVNGDAYPNGITVCVTTGIADNDATAPTADRYIVNVHYKAGQ